MRVHSSLPKAVSPIGAVTTAVLLLGCTDATGVPPIAPGAASTIVVIAASSRFVEKSRDERPGTRLVGGGCSVELPLTLRRGEHAVHRIAQIDTVTCDYVVARGDWVSRSLEHREGPSIPDGTVSGARAEVAMDGSFAPDTIVGYDLTLSDADRSTQSGASTRAMFIPTKVQEWMDVAVLDPIDIRLTGLQNWLDWEFARALPASNEPTAAPTFYQAGLGVLDLRSALGLSHPRVTPCSLGQAPIRPGFQMTAADPAGTTSVLRRAGQGG